MAGFTVVIMLILATTTQTSSFSLSSSKSYRISSSISMKSDNVAKKCTKALASTFIAFNLLNTLAVNADDAAPIPPPAPVPALITPTNIEDIPKVKLVTQRAGDTQAYSDVGRGFRMLRPFGYNEFDGAGSGYAIKFASLSNIDENVVVGSTPATAGKTSILDYGTKEKIGEKLAAKRGGKLISSTVRSTEGIVYYQFEFENSLDPSLPRTGPKNNRPTKMIELFELCVNKGRLWSVQATSNDRDFPGIHEKQFRTALASFIPRL
mmetsp:Transcript_31178/g.29727  ORF Transcript_31178/g.29727 Transcript_31178/m.29727 type:complete len:265 (+) Transcript_31178:100-894(+)|eukprot:CAMPEP_0119043004 /NCGR_PEP_ID=MMETSP1177-20130426/16340_1 /TAXON_ID=2985 /ORGANISM="Ochromonas sp, Strain CCMP1899" /LENGTH=264 /DNA_ID=CAMNT_0007010163 /DNA_START=95 /DNA_END=889 /DNA_ORIENTATION=-